ncbi:MAG: AlkZ family DNA glycosylase [Anaerolineae bacterium]|nr:AlkZ family DNA glycosylase [Anaerolineae bacterium]
MVNTAVQRLHNQQLVQTILQTPAEVVGWLGAAQAQEYQHAKWALGMRLPHGITDSAVEQAFNDGSILRTHVMRPTWHFVTPADIRWILELTAPRVNMLNEYMYRQLELDEAIFQRSNAAIIQALEGDKHLTRVELGKVLKQVGIVAEGMRLGYIVHRSELDAIICSGPRRGKQFTYALIAERAPHARILQRDEALVELVKRYFTSHGPATIKDFARWSGLTVADGKVGLEMAKPDMVEEVIEGKSYWYAASMPVRTEPVPAAYLLPPYDEYTIGYKDHDEILDPQYLEKIRNNIFGGVIMINSQIIGAWRRTFSKGTVIIETDLFRSLTDAENEAFATVLEQYGEFLEMPVIVAKN